MEQGLWFRVYRVWATSYANYRRSDYPKGPSTKGSYTCPEPVPLLLLLPESQVPNYWVLTPSGLRRYYRDESFIPYWQEINLYLPFSSRSSQHIGRQQIVVDLCRESRLLGTALRLWSCQKSWECLVWIPVLFDKLVFGHCLRGGPQSQTKPHK